MKASNRELAKQALRYLTALKSPLPSESNTEFYDQNNADYEALLTLNNEGLGGSEVELNQLLNATPSETEIKRIVKRLQKIDELILADYEKGNKIDITPKYWNNFFSGYEALPTGRCEQLKRGIKQRISKLGHEQSELFGKITMRQAVEFGYFVDGMDEDDFKAE